MTDLLLPPAPELISPSPNLSLPPRFNSPALSEFTEGPKVRKFTRDHLTVDTGTYAADAGDPITLRPWQASIFDDLYELDADGSRRYSQALIGLPKKNGKSFLAAIMALHDLVEGPPAAEVYLVANNKSQASDIIFQTVKTMIRQSEYLTSLLTVHRTDIWNLHKGSVLRPLVARVDSVDGLKPTLVVGDEIHRWPRDTEMWDLMIQASTRPNALVVGFTTAGFDRQTLCWRLYDYGKRVSSGEVDDPSFFFRWWEAEDLECDYTDPHVWASCNPALGDTQAYKKIAADAKTTPENQFRRLRLNQWTNAESAWIKAGAFEACFKPDYKIREGANVILGFDGSRTRDSTAVVAVELETLHVEVVACWEPEKGDPPLTEDVLATIRAAFERFNVLKMVADPAYWRAELELLSSERYPIAEFGQKTNQMFPATQGFETVVYEKRLSYSDPRLERHVQNCVVKNDPGSDRYKVVKGHDGRKIDIAIAALMAVYIAAETEVPVARKFRAFTV